MLTSITLNYTSVSKNENMQTITKSVDKKIRAEEMAVGNKTMDELGTIGFADVRRFRAHFIPKAKQTKINYVNVKGKQYKVQSIKDDGSGRFVTFDVTANDGDDINGN